MSLKAQALKHNAVAKEIQINVLGENDRMAVCVSSRMNHSADETVTLIQVYVLMESHL